MPGIRSLLIRASANGYRKRLLPTIWPFWTACGGCALLERPVVAALSRKSFIGERLHQPDPFQRLAGTLAATAIAVYLGAHIVRTHDIAASLDTVAMAKAIRGRPADGPQTRRWRWRCWAIWARERIMAETLQQDGGR